MASVQVVSAKSAFPEDTHVEKSLEAEERLTEEVTVTEVKAPDHHSNGDINEEEAAKAEYEDAVDDADDETQKEVAKDVKVVTKEPYTMNCSSEKDGAKEAMKPEIPEEGKTEKAKDDGSEENKPTENLIDETTKEEAVAEENVKKDDKAEENGENPVPKKENSNEMTENKVGEETAADQGGEKNSNE